MSEWLHLFCLAEKADLKDYVGICHYRRYYNFLDDIPNVEDILKEYDLIIRKPIIIPTTIKNQYKYCHNIEDLDILGDILKEQFKDYYDTYEFFLNSKMLIPCNMFIMKKQDFLNFMKMVKEVVKEFFWRVGVDLEKRIRDNESKYLKHFEPNNTYTYQIRLLTYVLERFTNIYILKNFTKMKAYPVIITENKYNIKNNLI
jgi:hypothetical protein